MNRFVNPILLIVPPEQIGLLLTGMLVCGGLALVVGARATGKALVIGAIAFPFVTVLVEALVNELFAAMPEWFVIPAAMLLLLAVYLMVGWALIRMIFGQKAIDEAKGHLLADALKGLLRRTFTLGGAAVLGGVILMLFLSLT